MTSKFKIEYFHKIPQTTSPYLQLLEAKKKIFGYKYEVTRAEQKPKSAQQTHPSHKHSKTQSHQKEKPRSTKVHSRKKRSHTQQNDERLHDSLFLNRDQPNGHLATKSLFAESHIDHSLNPHEFLRNYRQISGEQVRNIKSCTQQVESNLPKEKTASKALEKLEITEIEELITLIDSCVEEANDYIGYLSEKIEQMTEESNALRQQQVRILKLKDGIINEKQREIDRLRHQIRQLKPQPEHSFEIKRLLQVIQKVTEENNTLKNRLREMTKDWDRKEEKGDRERDRQKKDIYNEIHNKIDILNISIDKKEGDIQQSRQAKKTKSNTKGRFYR